MGLVHHSLRSECSAAMTGEDGRPYLATSAKDAQSFKAYSADRFKEKFFSFPSAYFLLPFSNRIWHAVDIDCEL